MTSGTQISSTGGSIELSGDATSSTSSGSSNRGIYIDQTATVSNTTGQILLIGKGSPAGTGSCEGIATNDLNTAITTTTGDITLRGFAGGSGGNSNHGVFVTNQSQVASQGGNIFFLGDARTSTSTGASNRGIDVEGVATVSNTSGNITFFGFGAPTGVIWSHK
ncbi:hypothetical protein [Simkania sp.]|uniref:hypothetical protein n=1 Tax=Simkania sp. TaxID=34094 RepID=UPI003B51A3CC